MKQLQYDDRIGTAYDTINELIDAVSEIKATQNEQIIRELRSMTVVPEQETTVKDIAYAAIQAERARILKGIDTMPEVFSVTRDYMKSIVRGHISDARKKVSND